MGLLHLELSAENIPLSEENHMMLSAVIQTLSLALANIYLRETLHHQSLHDTLTGLYNRRYLDEFLLKAINTAQRNQTPLSVVLLDIDFFKKINDEHGHDAGDTVLQEVSRVFQNENRTSDLICRYGGEEFIFVLNNCSLNDAIIHINKIFDKINSLSIYSGNQKLDRITLSAGISTFPESGKIPSDLIETSDKALYQAKNTGRNKIVSYSEMLNSEES
jgi:diguanylate cyclase (GGDEF)-like protein